MKLKIALGNQSLGFSNDLEYFDVDWDKILSCENVLPLLPKFLRLMSHATFRDLPRRPIEFITYSHTQLRKIWNAEKGEINILIFTSVATSNASIKSKIVFLEFFLGPTFVIYIG